MAITDLTGWTWTANETPYAYPNAEYYINFSSNSANFTRMKMQSWDISYYAIDGYINVFRSEGSIWTNNNYKTIQITGGTDATNSTLIAWLEANGTLTAPSPTPTKTFDLSTLQLSAGTHEIKVRARAAEFRDSEFSNSVSYVVSPSQITDLTGTTWRLSSGLVDMGILVHGTGYYDSYNSINFTSNGQSFIGMSSEDIAENWLKYDVSNSANSVQVQTINGWEASDAYKIIHITGGTDATNQDLIDWLYDNATLLTNGKEVTLTITTERHPAERDIFRIYDGQNTTGTLLYEKIGGGGSEYVLTPQTLICTSGYLYIELQGPGPLASGITTTGGVTGDTQIPHYGVNTPFEVIGNGTITIGDLDWDT